MAESLLFPGENLLLYGKTNAGKSEQLKRLIRAMATKEKPARVYVFKEPSTLTHLRPLQDEGICQIEAFSPQLDPIVFIDNACQGRLYRPSDDGKIKYVDGQPDQCSLIAFESASGVGDITLNALGAQAAAGYNVGGEPAPALKIRADGNEIIVPSGSRSHYLVAQRWLLDKFWASQSLPCPTVWTAHEDIVGLEKKAPDGDKSVEHSASMGIRGLIGPMIAGSALTARLPQYFVFTFRLVAVPAETSNKHVMFTGNHKDGSLEGIGNARCDVELRQEPADVPAMLRKIREKLAKGAKG